MSPLDRLRAYLELVRAPNLFTAMADVVAGFLFVTPLVGWDEGPLLALLLACSTCLYAAGVALNDVFDFEIDSRDRPERPLPSGRISVRTARVLGFGLLLAGVGFGLGASWLLSQGPNAEGQAGFGHRTGWVAVCLAAGVLLYDAYLKRTWLGPIGMGLCRALNVLLGMSAAARAWQDEHWLVAAALGTYIAGVTWLARSETGRASRWQLLGATVLILGGIGLLVPLPQRVEDLVLTLQAEPQRWYLLLGVLGAFTGLRCLQTVFDPEAEVIRAVVKHCLITLVFLDAAVCYVARDVRGAVLVLVLLIPCMLLGRWIYST